MEAILFSTIYHALGVAHFVKIALILSRRGTLELRVHWFDFVLEMYSEDQVMSVDESRVYAPPNKLQVRIQASILIKLSHSIRSESIFTKPTNWPIWYSVLKLE